MVTARVYAIIITCLLLLGVFFYLTTFFYHSGALYHAAGYLTGIASLGAVYYLFATGSLGRSWPRPFYFLLLSTMTIGFLFQIQHWDHADLLLQVAFAGLLLLYTIWYVTKKRKALTDHLKLLWVDGICVYALYRISWFAHSRTAEYSLMALLWLIFGLVNYERRQRELQRKLEEESFSPEIRGDEE